MPERIPKWIYRAAAHRKFNDEGTIEIDDLTKVSRSEDGGAYVQAWVWVYDDDITDNDRDAQAKNRFARPRRKGTLK